METDYLKNIEAKKKLVKQAGLLVIIMLLIFVFAIYKFAQNNGLVFTGTGFPANDDAYSVAKLFIQKNVRQDAEFPHTDYRAAHKNDSTFIISTVADFTEGKRKKTSNLKVFLKYKGGKQNDTNSWILLNISEEPQTN